MYLIVSIMIIITGILLLTFVKRLSEKKPVVICVSIIGFMMIAGGLIMLYLILSGRLVLPLSRT